MKTEGLRVSLLLDFYGNLLTRRQREIATYYYNDDLSLAEISELTGITRQGVRDSVKKAEQMLCDYEKNLLMYESYTRRLEELTKLRGEITALAEKYGIDKNEEKLKSIYAIIDGMQQ